MQAENLTTGGILLSAFVQDRENDRITVEWAIPPGIERRIEQGVGVSRTWVEAIADQPFRIFAHAIDDAVRHEASGGGAGAVVSRWIARPAEPGVATFFPAERLLHIPELAMDGKRYAVNLQLTRLDGVVFKLLSID